MNKKIDLYKGEQMKKLYPMCFLPGKDFYELHIPEEKSLEEFFSNMENPKKLNIDDLLKNVKNETYKDKKPQYITDFKGDIPEIIRKAKTYIWSLIEHHELSERIDSEKAVLFCMYGSINPYTFPRIFDYESVKIELEGKSKNEILKNIYMDILARKFMIQNSIIRNILKKSTLEWYLEDLLSVSDLSLNILKKDLENQNKLE